MRRVLFFVLCAVFLSSGLYAQKIRLREIDKFSKKERVETSVETLYTTMFLGSQGYYMKVKAQRVDSVYTLHASIAFPEITKYTDGNGIMLLLDNEETIYLTSMYTGISSPLFVDGPITFDTSFSLTKADVEKLKTHEVTDVRIVYIDGYYDREIKDKKRTLIKKMLNLLD